LSDDDGHKPGDVEQVYEPYLPDMMQPKKCVEPCIKLGFGCVVTFTAAVLGMVGGAIMWITAVILGIHVPDEEAISLVYAIINGSIIGALLGLCGMLFYKPCMGASCTTQLLARTRRFIYKCEI
jgi:hypothetical protein